jgi:hypothetical protein
VGGIVWHIVHGPVFGLVGKSALPSGAAWLRSLIVSLLSTSFFVVFIVTSKSE